MGSGVETMHAAEGVPGVLSELAFGKHRFISWESLGVRLTLTEGAR